MIENLLMTGGTGFIGTHLCRYFSELGCRVTVLIRKKNLISTKSIKYINSLSNNEVNYQAIINLAGEPLAKRRWSKKVKEELYNSRLQTTQTLINYVKVSPQKPDLFISGSAIGFYGNSLEQIFKEDTPPADDGFTHRLCSEWEKVALQAQELNIRVCLLRTGIVLGNEGGMLPRLLPLFRFCLGAQLGLGNQWMSWIHIKDVVRAVAFLVKHDNLRGSFNLCSPFPVTNQDFTHELSKVLKRMDFLTLPPFLINLLLGEMGEILLLQGQKVSPARLIEEGFDFAFPYLREALQDLMTPH